MIYAILSLPKFKIITSLFTIYLINRGFSFYIIMLGMSIFHVTNCIMEIPLGLFIDKYGPKKSLILNNIIYIIKIVLFFKASSFYGLFIMYFLRSINQSFTKKIDIVIISNQLENKKESNKFSKVYGNLVSISSIFLILSSLICGFFFDNYLFYIILLTIILHLTSNLLLLFYKEPNIKKKTIKEQELKNRLVNSFNYIQTNKLFQMFILFAFVTLVRVIIIDMKSILMKELQISTWFISLISIIGELNQVIIGKTGPKIINKFNNYTLYILIGLLLSFALIPILSNSIFIILIYCITPILNGLKNIFVATEMNKVITFKNKGTILSFLYVIEAILASFGMIIVGQIQKGYGTRTVFKIVALFISLILIPLSINYIKKKNLKINNQLC